MKKQLMRVVNTSAFSKFFKATALVLVLSGGYAAAQAAPASYAVVKSNPGVGKTEIKHLSSNNQSLLFEVKVENASGEKFQILVKDEINNTLYRGTFSGKDFSKKFLIPKTDSGKLTFTVKSATGNKSESFAINSNTRVVEEVVVTKVD